MKFDKCIHNATQFRLIKPSDRDQLFQQKYRISRQRVLKRITKEWKNDF